MDIKKTYRPGLLFAVLCFITGLFSAFAECFILAVISMVLNLKKKDQYRTKLSTVLTVLGIILGIIDLIIFIGICKDPNSSASYWLYKLIMK